jgi:hypothetical protein
MGSNYDTLTSTEEDRDDAIQCADDARPLEIGHSERACSELSDLVSESCKPV